LVGHLRTNYDIQITMSESSSRLTQPVLLAVAVRHVASGPVEQTMTIRRDIHSSHTWEPSLRMHRFSNWPTPWPRENS
jgi:hypothetical protein